MVLEHHHLEVDPSAFRLAGNGSSCTDVKPVDAWEVNDGGGVARDRHRGRGGADVRGVRVSRVADVRVHCVRTCVANIGVAVRVGGGRFNVGVVLSSRPIAYTAELRIDVVPATAGVIDGAGGHRRAR